MQSCDYCIYSKAGGLVHIMHDCYQPGVRFNSMQFAPSSVISSITYMTEHASCKAACVEQERNAEEPAFAVIFSFVQSLLVCYQECTIADGKGLA